MQKVRWAGRNTTFQEGVFKVLAYDHKLQNQSLVCYDQHFFKGKKSNTYCIIPFI